MCVNECVYRVCEMVVCGCGCGYGWVGGNHSRSNRKPVTRYEKMEGVNLSTICVGTWYFNPAKNAALTHPHTHTHTHIHTHTHTHTHTHSHTHTSTLMREEHLIFMNT